MSASMVRVGETSDEERELINLLTPSERKDALLIAAKGKLKRLSMMTKENHNAADNNNIFTSDQ